MDIASLIRERSEYDQIKGELETRQEQYEAKRHRLQSMRTHGGSVVDLHLSHQRSMIISGQPGIDRLLKGLITIYVSYNSRHTIFTPDGAHVIEDLEKNDFIENYLDDSSVWYLSDAIPNGFVTIDELADWMVIQASSPAKSKLGDWQKQKGIPIWYMDTWSWQEMYSIT
ncbi:hypothetical protein Dda_4986 [Drechslerella dactyloides]|uniref:Uncharacterized protein n=1 Tax=Drechslerella dactyloides TaxID=74499 RepID=A0AAD6J2D6_DREDA|nr:hypothetical protein Dda_4986 [Drechslerella dactyloides]